MRLFFILLFISFSFITMAHEGHHEISAETMQEMVRAGRPTSWTQWIGGFHLILLNFPIALINMLAISEVMFALTKRTIFEFASRFLVISAAILSPITASLGFIYSYSAPYEGLMATFLTWHMWLGISTAIIAMILAFIRQGAGLGKLYYSFLFLLFLLVNSASFFGGGMSFGPYHLFPPL